MPKINYVQSCGNEHQVDVSCGTSVMRGAVDNAIPGIDGDCGGECACATCHVYVDPQWLDQVGPRTPGEEELLNFAAALQPNSRLACQIRMTEALDGLRVQMPAGQH
jgi:2Fe-2S ferredoxin